MQLPLNSYSENEVELNSSNAKRDANSFLEAEHVILQIYPPFLLILGITGNMITILILRSKSLRHNFVAMYLTYLAFINILNLAIGTTRLWIIGLIDSDIRNFSVYTCKIHFILTYALHTTSNWLMAAVTSCKLLYVQDPSRATRICSKTFVHALAISIIMCVTAFELYLSQHHYIAIKAAHSESGRLLSCDLSRDNIYHILQITIFFIVPGSLIILMNIGILIKVGSYRRFDHLKTPVVVKKERMVQILAGILFACDIQILLNELPYAMQHLFGPKMFEDTPEGRYKFNFFYHVSAMMLYTNCSINFVIYCFFGDHFREELRRIFRPCLSLLCVPRSRWVESTVDEDGMSEEHHHVHGLAPRRVKVTSKLNSDDFKSKLSLLNLFDSAHAEARRERSQANVVEKLTTLKIQDSAV
ncbi:C-C chemokine receptor type 1 [Biomphalaria glabrata]|nr:C-C chemokine receptor type 1-like [Biomphalaria glabrata]